MKFAIDRFEGEYAVLEDIQTKEVRNVLKSTMERSDVAVVLMTAALVQLCPELIMDYKLNSRQPLIVEIPDRHGNGRTSDSITKYVHDAIGIKMD